MEYLWRLDGSGKGDIKMVALSEVGRSPVDIGLKMGEMQKVGSVGLVAHTDDTSLRFLKIMDDSRQSLSDYKQLSIKTLNDINNTPLEKGVKSFGDNVNEEHLNKVEPLKSSPEKTKKYDTPSI